MVATKSPNSSFNTILEAVKAAEKEFSFIVGTTFSWSPETKTITYKVSNHNEAAWSLLHELAHAKLGHTTYNTDFELLTLEVQAWNYSKKEAKKYGLIIDGNYIEDCLDSYRDWLHRRSTCPTCGTAGLQQTQTEYHCHNCNTVWHVTAARFCRPYRRKVTQLRSSGENGKRNSIFR